MPHPITTGLSGSAWVRYVGHPGDGDFDRFKGSTKPACVPFPTDVECGSEYNRAIAVVNNLIRSN